MKQILIGTFVGAILFAFTSAGVFAYSFNRNLTTGSTGQDVLELQRVLNSNEQTKLAEVGPGSPGNETTYFGAITKSGVIAYQNLFRQAILIPVGLTFGTGYFGPSTREHLNSGPTVNTTPTSGVEDTTQNSSEVQTVSSSGNAVSSSLLSGNLFSSLEDSKELYLFYPSKYEGKQGDTLTLHGTGFESKNTVYLDNNKIEVLSNSKTRLTFKIPSSIPDGKYAIEVKNSKGTTDTDTFFIIKESAVKDPIITGISPTKGYYAEKVTITGSGFTAKNNEVRTSYGVVGGIPSEDGTTLEFEVRPYPDTPGIQEGVDLGQDVSWDISINIINGSGISNRTTFTLEF